MMHGALNVTHVPGMLSLRHLQTCTKSLS